MIDKHKKTVMLAVDLAVILVLIVIDQFTKYLAALHLKDKDAYVIADGVLELRYLENSGAAFGLLQNQKMFFLVLAILVILIIVYVLFRMPTDRRYNALNVLLVMICAGAAGNMIDRIRGPYVVDFIYISLINFPIFNMADIYVTVATFLFVLLLLFYYKEQDFAFLSIRQQTKVREWK